MRLPLPALLLLLAAPALAQQTPSDAACTYEACALRVEPSLFGLRLVRGAEGAAVAEPRLLGLGPLPLSEAVAESPAALTHARTYERSYRTTALLAAGAGVLLFFAVDRDDLFSEEVQAGAAAGTAGLLLASIPFDLRSRRALARAVWAYNAELAR